MFYNRFFVTIRVAYLGFIIFMRPQSRINVEIINHGRRHFWDFCILPWRYNEIMSVVCEGLEGIFFAANRAQRGRG